MVFERFTFDRSPSCPLHDPDSLIREVDERTDRVSSEWTPAQLFAEIAGGEMFLNFDWPVTARATCHACRHEWEPLMRRARFRRERCPACGSDDLVETEVLTGIDPRSPWADRPLAALGLPRAHIHEVIVGSGASMRRRHIEVTGDLVTAREAAPTW
jgi:hypothetical protein